VQAPSPTPTALRTPGVHSAQIALPRSIFTTKPIENILFSRIQQFAIILLFLLLLAASSARSQIQVEQVQRDFKRATTLGGGYLCGGRKLLRG